MGQSYGSSISRNGLVAYYDAANIKSYPKTGTIWKDVSGNGYDLTLTNGPTWNSDGYFANDADSYFTGAGGSKIPTGNSPYTIGVIARQTSSWKTNGGLISIGGFGVANGSNALRTLNNNIGHFHHYWWANDLSLTSNAAGLSLGQWFMVHAQFDGVERSIWVNGVKRVSNNPTGHNVTSTTIQVSKTVGGEYQEGDMSIAFIYDRALTQGEIDGNLKAFRGRFGL